jgi:hypothetical protein
LVSVQHVKLKQSLCQMTQLKDEFVTWQKTQKRDLLKMWKKSKWFALQLDESTDIQNNGILVSYVWYTDYNVGDVTEDILCVSVLPTQTTSAEIFKAIGDFIEKKRVGVENCVGLWQALGSGGVDY